MTATDEPLADTPPPDDALLERVRDQFRERGPTVR